MENKRMLLQDTAVEEDNKRTENERRALCEGEEGMRCSL